MSYDEPTQARATDARRPRVAVYREMLLNPTEPYIRTQAEALRRYESFYVGVSRVPNGLALPDDRTFVLHDRYVGADRALDRLLTRLPHRGRMDALARGGLLARASRQAFIRFGRSPRLVRAIAAARATLVHAHTGINGAHALPLARALDLPLVVTFHGYDATASDAELARHPLRGGIYLQRRAELQRDAALAIAVSGFIRDRVVARGWPAERVVVHHMGVDTGQHAPAPDAVPVGERAPIVFYAGRLIEKKGLRHLIDALALVRERIPDAEIVVAGNGPLRGALAARAEAARVPIRFLGRVTQAGVDEWMQRAAVDCMPSVRAANGDSEGLPTAVVEAMACGVPVVASAHAGIPEAVVHEETGLLAPEGDVPALAAHLTRLLDDPTLRARFGAAGRARALRHFDHRRQAERLEALYDEVREEWESRHGRLPSPPAYREPAPARARSARTRS